MNITILNYGNGMCQVCVHWEDLVFLDGCVLHINDRTLFEKESKSKPNHYHNPVKLDDLDINELGDLKHEIEDKYPNESKSILKRINIKP